MNCDNCSHYCWYYDRCEKWDCEVDGREVHDCFEPIPTEQDQAKTPNKSPNCIGGGKRRRLAWKESSEQSQRIDTDKISRSAGDKQTLHVRWKSSPDANITNQLR